jgi:hypothetical protein
LAGVEPFAPDLESVFNGFLVSVHANPLSLSRKAEKPKIMNPCFIKQKRGHAAFAENSF